MLNDQLVTTQRCVYRPRPRCSRVRWVVFVQLLLLNLAILPIVFTALATSFHWPIRLWNRSLWTSKVEFLQAEWSSRQQSLLLLWKSSAFIVYIFESDLRPIPSQVTTKIKAFKPVESLHVMLLLRSPLEPTAHNVNLYNLPGSRLSTVSSVCSVLSSDKWPTRWYLTASRAGFHLKLRDRFVESTSSQFPSIRGAGEKSKTSLKNVRRHVNEKMSWL